MATARFNSTYTPFHTHILEEIFAFSPRKRNGGTKLSLNRAKISESKLKRANLSARKKERIKLPSYGEENSGNKRYHISEFFSHPAGVEAILNARALQSFQPLDFNLYRCTLPQIQLLNFEAAPVLDLQVSPTSEDCVVEMLSCKFEGSEVLERQNKHFSASLTNHIKWGDSEAESFLDIDVKLDLVLEIYTQPFTMLPISAVEGPGNIMIQALVDRLVPLLLQQLLQNFEEWVHQQQRKCLQ